MKKLKLLLSHIKKEYIYWYCMLFFTVTNHRYVEVFGKCYLVIGENVKLIGDVRRNK